MDLSLCQTIIILAAVRSGEVIISVTVDTEEDFEFLIRNPYWSQTTEVFVKDESLPAIKGYLRINRTWKNQESITLKLDMRTEAIYPVPYESQDLMVVWDKDRMIP